MYSVSLYYIYNSNSTCNLYLLKQSICGNIDVGKFCLKIIDIFIGYGYSYKIILLTYNTYIHLERYSLKIYFRTWVENVSIYIGKYNMV